MSRGALLMGRPVSKTFPIVHLHHQRVRLVRVLRPLLPRRAVAHDVVVHPAEHVQEPRLRLRVDAFGEEVRRQLDVFERKGVVILARCHEGQVRLVESAREKERLVVLLA